MIRISELFDRIKEIWSLMKKDGTTNPKLLDFTEAVQFVWPLLGNNSTLVDVVGVWTVVAGDGPMDLTKFGDFINALAKVRFQSDVSSSACGKFIDEIMASVAKKDETIVPSWFSAEFVRVIDKRCLHELLKVDSLLKTAFSTFAGETVSMTGNVLWDEVKKMSLGMEIEGFLNFSSAYSVVPELLSENQCESLAKMVFENYSVHGNEVSAPSTALLYPQFELLVCFTAIAVFENRTSTAMRAKPQQRNGAFAKKVAEIDSLQVSNILADFFKQINLGKSLASLTDLHRHGGGSREVRGKSSAAAGTERESTAYSSDKTGRTPIARSVRPEDQYTSSLKHGRQAMVFRLNDLFQELKDTFAGNQSHEGDDSRVDLIRLSDNKSSEIEVLNVQQRFASKPVVITDAIPLPVASCPPEVHQLLKSALSHHNLGSFEEAIMFFEASLLYFAEKAKIDPFTEGVNDEVPDPVVPMKLTLELELYVTLGKGNVFRSCGEDEQAMLQYMDGWRRAKSSIDRDWEHIFLNSMGSLAYYSIRYDVALLCFHAVLHFRQTEYGPDSADTATALNNEGCCLFGMSHRGEARLRFETAWAIDCKVLGHRAPRTILIWQNCDKARRSVVTADPKSQKDELNERVHMRSDVDRLLVGGKFTIKAIPPPSGGKKKKGGGGGKKGKKKK